ncbi:hypothetical protein LTR86_006370 [Recurvomyces mirabilis]|nr:hypothetical protein LTR86_006370 [Recurvomyces mirabilis]
MEQQPAAEKQRMSIKGLTDDGRDTSKELQAIYNTNATASPLLRLPPELRLQIWKLVLGGHVIHLQPKGKHTICQSNVDDFELATSLMAVNDGQPKRRPSYNDHHALCKNQHYRTTGTLTLPLRLLQVARQIHQEAALLPYCENTFTAGPVMDLADFAACLISEHARSMRRVVIHHTLPSQPAAWLADLKILGSRLSGVQKLAVMRETVGRSPQLPEGRGGDVRTFEVAPKKVLGKPRETVRTCDIMVAAYHIPITGPYRVFEWSIVSRSELQEWESSIRKSISDAWELDEE